MHPYNDIDGDSGIMAYEIEPNYIIIKFDDSSEYLYTYSSAGRDNIENMKKLAQNGNGLNSFINRHVRKLYESKRH